MTTDNTTPATDPATPLEKKLARRFGAIAKSDAVRADILGCAPRIGRQLAKKEDQTAPDDALCLYLATEAVDRWDTEHPKHMRRARMYKPDFDADKEDVMRRLESMGVELRLNERSLLIEYRRGGNTKSNWDNWHNLEEHRATITCAMQSHCITEPYIDKKGEVGGLKHRKISWNNSIGLFAAIADGNRQDAFADYLRYWCGGWDGVPRIDGVLSHLFHIPDTDPKLASWAFRSTMLAAVNRTFNPGAKHDTVAVLVGEEGIGKSSLWAELVGRMEWFTDCLDLGSQTKEQMEALLGNVIVECAELHGLRRAEAEKLNAFISRRVDKARMAYAKARSDIPRRIVIVGTTNKPEVLPVEAGAQGRRWLPVEIQKYQGSRLASQQRVVEYMAENRDQLWGEAVAAIRKGESTTLPNGLEDASAAAVQTHRRRNTVVEDAVQKYLAENADGFSLRDICLHVDSSSPQRVEKAVAEYLKGEAGMECRRMRIDDPLSNRKALVRRWYRADS